MLAEANVGAQADAVERLKSALPQLDLVRAASGAPQGPTVTPVSTDLLDRLGGVRLVERALAHDVGAPRLSLHADGELVQRPGLLIRRYDQFTTAAASPSATMAALAEGVMVLVNAIDQSQPAVIELIADLERVLVGDGSVNLYVGGRGRTGFRPHWDDHEVVIIPLWGRKAWEVREPPLAAPRKEVLATTDADTPVHETFEVGVGQALHIPRGWPHVVTPLDPLAAHLTLGVRRLAWPEVLDRLGELSVWSPEGRGDLTVDPEQPAALGSADGELLDSLLRVIVANGGLEDARASWRARLKSRLIGDFDSARSALVDGGLDSAYVRANYPGGFHLVAWDPDGDEVVLAGGGLRFVLAHHAVPSFARLARGAPVAIGELCHSCSTSDRCAEELVLQLAGLGLVEFISPAGAR